MSMAFDLMFIDTCTGDVLDERAGEKQITRKQATPSYYEVLFDGVESADMEGDRFMVGGYYFVLTSYDGGYYLQSETNGSETNYILSGENVIPVRNTMNLTSATLGDLYMAGTVEEKDESLRERYKAAVRGPSENGNTQQYKTWCEEFEGVGRAISTPLAYGANTLKMLIISSDGTAPTTALIEDIQEVIDPGSEGLGEGKAFVGCKFYAVGAIETPIKLTWYRHQKYLKLFPLNTPSNLPLLPPERFPLCIHLLIPHRMLI